MELVFILVPIFVFVLLKIVLDQRAAARSDHLRLLEEALKNPAVDRATLENLTWQLTGNRPVREPQGPGKFLAFLLAIGWLALFLGIGLWVTGEMTRLTELRVAGIITGILGFGFVTYPFALRELEARKAPQ